MNNLLVWTNGSLGLQQLLIVLVVLLICAVVFTAGMMIYQTIKFKKSSFEKSVMTTWLIAVIWALICLAAVFNIVGFIIYFGENMMPDNFSLAKTLDIVFVALCAACAVAIFAILLLANKYVALGIGKETINIFGELFKTSKVISLVSDKERKIISLHIATGKRVVKRYSYSVTSMCGQCLESATSVLGVSITEGDDKEIYIKEVQKRQEEFRQTLTKSAADRGVTSSSASKSSSASTASKASTAKKIEEVVEKKDEAKSE